MKMNNSMSMMSQGIGFAGMRGGIMGGYGL